MSGTNKTDIETLNHDVIVNEAFELRRSGVSLREIGKRLGIGTTTAKRYVDEVLLELQADPKDIEKFRALEIARLERLLETIEQKVKDGDLQAHDRAIKINQRISALKGLDVQKHEHNIGEETLAALDMVKIREKLAEAIDRKHRDESGQGSK